MKENKFNYLIKTNNSEEVVVSCKELYLELELAKQHWSKWYTRNIINNKFFTEGVDYQTLPQWANGNETLDFALTLDTAKKISMTVMTDKGNEVRDYFLQVERERNQLIQNQLPQDYSSALRALADEVDKRKEIQELSNRQQRSLNKADNFTQNYINSNDNGIEISTYAKKLKKVGFKFSYMKLYRVLEKHKIKDKRSKGVVIRSKYHDLGWFVYDTVDNRYGYAAFSDEELRITRLGQVKVYNLLANDGLVYDGYADDVIIDLMND